MLSNSMNNPTVTAEEAESDFKERILLIITAVVNYLFFVLGFFIIIPIAVVEKAADGSCMLYADSSNFGPTDVCSYSIAVATLFQVFYSLGRAIIVTLILLDKLKTSPSSSGIIKIIVPLLLNPKFLLSCTVVDGIAWFLTLVSACIVSRGFDVMCYEIFLPKPERCGEVISVISSGKVLENYYRPLIFTEVSVWLSWLLWILMIAIDMISLRTQGLLPQSVESAIERCRRPGAAATVDSSPREARASSITPNWFVALKRRLSAKSESSV